MTHDPVCTHGERPLDGCPDCDPPVSGRTLAVTALLAIVVILAVAFAVAWRLV